MNEIGNNLKRARLLKNLSLNEAGKLLKMSGPGIAKYEKGEIKPNSQKIIEFAQAYDVPALKLLESYVQPKMKFTSFRKSKKLKGQNLELLQEVIQNEVAKLLEVIKINDCKKQIKIKKYKCSSLIDADEAATQFRKDVNFSPIQPISDLINTLENLGIVIIQILNANNLFDGFDGLSEYVDDIPVIVLLDGIEDGSVQRFTIAHELGHLVLNFTDEKLDKEKLCDRFANSLLMPKEAVINEFGLSRNNINFYELKAFKKEYNVSLRSIIHRLKDLKIISEYTYKKLSASLSKNFGSKNEPLEIKPEKSYQFKKIVYRLEADNIISVNKACELLGVSTDEYYDENNNYGY